MYISQKSQFYSLEMLFQVKGILYSFLINSLITLRCRNVSLMEVEVRFLVMPCEWKVDPTRD